MGIFIGVILWIVLCFIVGAGAKNKGRFYAGFFFLSLFFSPLLSGLILLVLGENI